MSDTTWDRAPEGRSPGMPEALFELVEQYDAELLRICIVAGASPDVARDAVQSAWVRVATRLSTLRDRSHVRRWLIAIAVNEMRQLWRRQRTAARHVAPLEMAEAVTGTEPTRDPDLACALAKLSLRDRELLSLTVVAGLRSAEAGKIIGLSGPGVRTRKARILTALRKELEG